MIKEEKHIRTFVTCSRGAEACELESQVERFIYDSLKYKNEKWIVSSTGITSSELHGYFMFSAILVKV